MVIVYRFCSMISSKKKKLFYKLEYIFGFDVACLHLDHCSAFLHYYFIQFYLQRSFAEHFYSYTSIMSANMCIKHMN